MNRSRFLVLLAVILIPFMGIAQEVTSPLGSNPVLMMKKEKGAHYTYKRAALTLPFFDDFSDYTGYPDSSRWTDKYTYVNNHFPISPVSVGVVTFDGVGPIGIPYDTLTTSTLFSFSADTLTSQKINLAFTEADSVYFSFFYQAQGRGDKPDIDDSLILEFHDPLKPYTEWSMIWSVKGFNAGQKTDTLFRPVIVKVDTAFLKNDFQFRFRNKATLSGNVDHWHVDYVYLNKQRNRADTLFNDVAFVYYPSSMLKGYQAMPYKQYKSTNMADSLTNYIKNNHPVANNTSYNYNVKDAVGTVLNPSNLGSGNIDPFSIPAGYSNCTSPTPCRYLLRPPVNYTFPDPLTAPTVYTIEHIIKPSSDFKAQNDTIRRKQIFGNYYAYDDGTAELAYGLNKLGAKLGYKFSLNYPDSIRAVDMYFNWMPNGSVNSVNQRQFRITIWDDAGGKPGNIVFQDSIVTPAYMFDYYKDWGLMSNVFFRYKLTSPQFLSGTFYVGWVQYTGDLLNIGLDLHNNAMSNTFYNINGTWNSSVIKGAIMIRPVFGDANELAGIQDAFSSDEVLVYPNPAKETITIRFSSNDKRIEEVILYDVSGKIIVNNKMSDSVLDVHTLDPGIYFMLIKDNQFNTIVKKIIISR